MTRRSLVTIALLAMLGCDTHADVPRDRGEQPEGSSGVSPTASGPLEIELEPGEPARLAATDRAIFRLDVQAGQFVAVTLHQNGIDVALDVASNKDVALVSKWDKSPGILGVERFAILVERSGVLRIDAVPVVPRARNGDIELHIEGPRPATQDDRRRAQAYASWTRAERLRTATGELDAAAAQAAYAEALAGFVAINDRREQGHVQHDLAALHRQIGDARASLRYAHAALESLLAAADEGGRSKALRTIGNAHYFLGNYHRARWAYESSLELGRALEDPGGIAGNLNNLAAIFELLGDFERSASYLRESIALFEASEDVLGMTYPVRVLADQYLQFGVTQPALELLEHVLQTTQQHGYRSQQGDALAILGDVYMELLEEPRQALELFEQAYEIRLALGNEYEASMDLDAIGRAYQFLGDLELARALHQQAFEIQQRLGTKPAQLITLESMGLAAARAGDPIEAARAFERCLALARELDDGWAIAWDTAYLAEQMLAMGARARALQLIRDAIAKTDAMRAAMVDEQLRATYTGAVGEFYQIYLEILLPTDAHGGHGAFDDEAIEAAFLAHERGRATTLLELRNAASSNPTPDADPPAMQAVESAYKHSLTRAQSVAALEQADAAVESERSEKRSSASPPPRKTVRDLDLRALREGLAARDAALVEFALGPKQSWAWFVDAEGIDLVALGTQDDLELLARRYHRALAARALSKPGESATERDRRIERADADAARIGTELAQHLLAPWAHDLPTKLFVVAEGALNYVPIAALPDPVDPKRAMVAAHEIIQLPTAALLIASAPDRQSATTNGISIWADPVFDKTDARALEFDRRADDPPPASNTSDLLRLADDPNIAALPRLRFSGHEAEAIASFADRVTTEMHRGFAAHRDALLEAAPKSSIVHIATHGLINDARPEQSGLVLSRLRDDGADRPGLVTLSDIYALDLRAELVVLSACETALGQELRGEGLVGLVHAFVSAGAERVLASLWKIHDRGTAELMHRFYRELLQRGLSPAQALAAAQRSMAADPRWQAPYYWAPFVLYGDEGP